MFTWEMMVILFIGIVFLILWCWELLKKDAHYAVLFDKGQTYVYSFRTGKLQHGLAVIKVKGLCQITIYNSYTKRIFKKVEHQKNKSQKIVLLFKTNQYFTLKIEDGQDFLVEIINFMPRY